MKRFFLYIGLIILLLGIGSLLYSADTNLSVGTIRIAPTQFYITEYDNGDSGSSKTINANNGKIQKLTLTAACAVSWTQPTSGTVNVLLKIVQATGTHYNITWTSTLWPAATPPTITATDGAIDIISCYLDGTSVFCVPNQDFR